MACITSAGVQSRKVTLTVASVLAVITAVLTALVVDLLRTTMGPNNAWPSLESCGTSESEDSKSGVGIASDV